MLNDLGTKGLVALQPWLRGSGVTDFGPPGGLECGCDRLDTTPGLMTIDQALAAIDNHVWAVDGIENIAAVNSRGRILSRPVTALLPSPRFDNSAMDGFAVCLKDLPGKGPWSLPVTGCQFAGSTNVARMTDGAAVQIFTGAALPDGVDAVIMQERVEFDGETIIIRNRPKAGENIRRTGEDMCLGDVVVPAGCRISPREIAGIAAAGHGSVSVSRRVRVGLLATGDEVRQPGQVLTSAQICDVNTPMLISSMEDLGADVVTARTGGDTRDEIRNELQTLSETVDLVVTTGGISVGAADHVKPALRDAGGEIVLSGVAIKPGKPISMGRIGTTTWLGLPGNPVSAFVTWTVFGQRILDRLSGRQATKARRRHVIAGHALHHKPGRCELRLASIIGTDAQGREIAGFPAQTNSARVSQLSNADGLILVPAETGYIPEGGLVEFMPLPSN